MQALSSPVITPAQTQAFHGRCVLPHTSFIVLMAWQDF